MKYASYLFFRITVFVFQAIPFWLMYRFSDLIAWLFQYILKYRKHIIQDNISLVYPNISKNERNKVVKSIYKNLADITTEGIKGVTASDKAIKKRHRWVNPELLDQCYSKNKSVILVTGHYNNWEWGAFSPNFYLKHTAIGFYKPMTNPYINEYFIRKRANTGTVLADINQTRDYFQEYHDKKSIFLMAADQSPTKPELAVWTNFLGVNTPCLHGPEKYAREYELPVVFCKVRRIKRGYYEVSLEWINETGVINSKEGAMTKDFMAKLELLINENPGSWLWSHRRWKHANFKK